ncbi:MAG: hydrogenase maturation protease [Bacteroidales bacterium]
MLYNFLHKNQNRNILVTGVGNVLKQDDGIGVYISNNLKNAENIKVLTVEVSIENYIGKINEIKPDILVIIDAMNFGKQPGHWDILPIDKIKGYTTNTHNITLDKVAELFHSEVYLLGIQPKHIHFGEDLSTEVLSGAQEIINQINTYTNKKLTCIKFLDNL